MAANVLFYDLRIEGGALSPSPGLITLELDGEMTLAGFIEKCLEIARRNNGIDTLAIMAHELEGGYGMEFCRENLTTQTVQALKSLEGKVQQIVLYICSVAGFSDEFQKNDSISRQARIEELSRKIAEVVKVDVSSSDEMQIVLTEEKNQQLFGFSLYREESDLGFGEWQGKVSTYDLNGRISEQKRYAAVENERGQLSEPRL